MTILSTLWSVMTSLPTLAKALPVILGIVSEILKAVHNAQDKAAVQSDVAKLKQAFQDANTNGRNTSIYENMVNSLRGSDIPK